MASPGSILGRTLGHYHISEQIGAGGMGVVYRARDARLERDVALKVLPAGALADDSARKRFRREALALSRLNHPNIATVFDFDSQEEIDFLVTELVSGAALEEKPGPLPEKEIIQIGLQLADGLEAAHRQGVIHRDLKPGNLRLTAEGRLKILDFGLAKRMDTADHATLTQSFVEERGPAGTLAYMAPEQLRGEKVDTRTDLWAAGAVLYELATGSRPFEGRTATALADEILHAAVRSPQALRPALSARLADVILKCLEKDPDHRYQTAKELLVDLRRLAMPGSTAGVGVPGSGRHAWRRRLAIMAAVLGSVILISGVAWFQVRKAKQVATKSSLVTAAPANRVSTGGAASASTEANEYFEKAMLFLKTQYDLPRARQMLERALALDSHFAEARAWYGYSHLLMVDGGYSNDSGWFYKAEQEARRALQDDPSSGRAHSVLAAVYLSQGRKELVPTEVEKALAGNRADLDARIWLINYYSLNGDPVQARVLAKQMLELDPLFFPARMNVGDSLVEEGKFSEAILQYEKILEADSHNPFAITRLARALMSIGDLAKARRVLQMIQPADRKNFEARLAWALLFALEGGKTAARKEMDSGLQTYAQISVWTMLPVAEFYSVMGDVPEALQWLERAVRSGDERVEWFRRDPLLANIRQHPRFQQIMESAAYRQRQRRAPASLP